MIKLKLEIITYHLKNNGYERKDDIIVFNDPVTAEGVPYMSTPVIFESLPRRLNILLNSDTCKTKQRNDDDYENFGYNFYNV